MTLVREAAVDGAEQSLQEKGPECGGGSDQSSAWAA